LGLFFFMWTPSPRSIPLSSPRTNAPRLAAMPAPFVSAASLSAGSAATRHWWRLRAVLAHPTVKPCAPSTTSVPSSTEAGRGRGGRTRAPGVRAALRPPPPRGHWLRRSSRGPMRCLPAPPPRSMTRRQHPWARRPPRPRNTARWAWAVPTTRTDGCLRRDHRWRARTDTTTGRGEGRATDLLRLCAAR
jgi:hypothetical protein